MSTVGYPTLRKLNPRITLDAACPHTYRISYVPLISARQI